MTEDEWMKHQGEKEWIKLNLNSLEKNIKKKDVYGVIQGNGLVCVECLDSKKDKFEPCDLVVQSRWYVFKNVFACTRCGEWLK